MLNADSHGYTSASFKEGEKIIPKGYEAAKSKQEMLAKLSLNGEDWKAYLEGKRSRTRREVPVPQFLEVVGGKPNYNEALRKILAEYVSKPIDPAELEESLTRLTGTAR